MSDWPPARIWADTEPTGRGLGIVEYGTWNDAGPEDDMTTPYVLEANLQPLIDALQGVLTVSTFYELSRVQATARDALADYDRKILEQGAKPSSELEPPDIPF